MPSGFETKSKAKQKESVLYSLSTLYKTLSIYGLIFCSSFIFYLSDYPKRAVNPFSVFRATQNLQVQSNNPPASPTNITHLVFAIISSEGTWHGRRLLGETWWRPNSMRGYVFLDAAPMGDLLPWPSSSPPFRVYDDLTELVNDIRPASPWIFRFVHAIFEVMREEKGNENLRWLIIGDDDTVFFVDNLVDVLSEFDHTKYNYIGGVSESMTCNFLFSFNMGFGGAGIALSYPLAKAFAKNLEGCFRRYPTFGFADAITMSCIVDMGVNLSPHKGFHQMDFHGDISGLLSAHPMAPLVSLHHFDIVEAIFPGMDRIRSVRHLMKAGNADQSRLLQQTICHHRQLNWTVSVSWGYSVHIYEKIVPRSWVQVPIQTFQQWIYTSDPPFHTFNTRLPSADPCESPHVFFLKAVEKLQPENFTLSSYYRFSPRLLPPCVDTAHSADFVTHIHVHSPPTKRIEKSRCECCDIEDSKEMKKAVVKFRECKPDEILA